MTLRELDGTQWRLVAPGRAEDGAEVTVRFEGAKVSGSGGCNRYFGSVEEAGSAGAVRIGPLGATRMSCGEVSDAAETRFLTALGAVQRFSVEGNRLTLGADDADELIFERVPGEPD